MEIFELEYSLLPLLNLKLAEDTVYQVSLQTNMRDMLEHHAALFHISMKTVSLSEGCVLVLLHFWSSSSGTVFSLGV